MLPVLPDNNRRLRTRLPDFIPLFTQIPGVVAEDVVDVWLLIIADSHADRIPSSDLKSFEVEHVNVWYSAPCTQLAVALWRLYLYKLGNVLFAPTCDIDVTFAYEYSALQCSVRFAVVSCCVIYFENPKKTLDRYVRHHYLHFSVSSSLNQFHSDSLNALLSEFSE
jgi:hypothetical protein